MGLPASKLIIATNSNDILHRFFTTSGSYTKRPVHGPTAHGGIPADGALAHADGVKETLSPAMDILVSSNFERLLWFLAFQTSDAGSVSARREDASHKIKTWMSELKSGGFAVGDKVIAAAKEEFESERVSDEETLSTIQFVYNGATMLSKSKNYVLDPHSAIGIAASLRSIARLSSGKEKTCHISLATAHPAKFSGAVTLALKDEKGFDFDATVLPKEFVGLEEMESRVTKVKEGSGWEGMREIVRREVEMELEGKR
jgi:threonine synthase